MAKRGAKNKYEQLVKPYLDIIRKKVKEGVTEADIAKALNISTASLSNYKRLYKELADALNKDKGAEVLEQLKNAGIKAALGYKETNRTITIIVDPVTGKKTKQQIVETETYYPPNATLNKFYVMNFGKAEGLTDDPLAYELKKSRAELDEALARAKNWDLDLNDDNDN